MDEGRGGVAVMGLRCGDWRDYICRHTFFLLLLLLSFFLPFFVYFFPFYLFFGFYLFSWRGSFLFGRGRLATCVTAL